MGLLVRRAKICSESLPETNQALVISTVVGAGDGGPATNASLEWPRGIAVDESGNVYIADAHDSCVRMVDTRGVISTVFGAVMPGEGGQAAEAVRSCPEGVVLDREANLFIADGFNHCVHRVNKNGFSSVIAGRGRHGFAGDDGPSTKAKLHNPRAVAIDGDGDLFIADTYNNRVRKIGKDGTITTVAGCGAPGFSGDGGPATGASLFWPGGLTVDNQGNLFISDRGNNRIRRVDRKGIISTFVGSGAFEFRGDGGIATEAALRWPLGLVADLEGNLFFADSFNHRVRMVDSKGVITTVAGGKDGASEDGVPATATSLIMPCGVALNGEGELLISDTRDYRIRRVDRKGIIRTIAGTGRPRYGGDRGPALQATLCCPHGVAIDPRGNIFIADSWNQSVRQVDREGIISTVIQGKRRCSITVSGSSIPEKGELQVKSEAKKEPEYFPISVAIDSAGRVFFADKDNNRVCLIVDNGAMRVVAGKGTPGFAGDGGPAVDALLWWPYAVVVDRAGALLIADSGNNRIRRVSLDGTIDTLAGNGLSGLSGDGGAATKASLNHPCGLAFDNEDNLLIADSWNHCIRKVDGKGKITTVAGIGQPGCTGDGGPARKARLYHPYGMAVSRDGGIWVTERSSNRVRLVRPDGTIVSVAGEEIAGFHGDGGPAARAKLNRPCGIAMDAAGNLYIADSWNHRIRRIASNVMA